MARALFVVAVAFTCFLISTIADDAGATVVGEDTSTMKDRSGEVAQKAASTEELSVEKRLDGEAVNDEAAAVVEASTDDKVPNEDLEDIDEDLEADDAETLELRRHDMEDGTSEEDAADEDGNTEEEMDEYKEDEEKPKDIEAIGEDLDDVETLELRRHDMEDSTLEENEEDSTEEEIDEDSEDEGNRRLLPVEEKSTNDGFLARGKTGETRVV